MLYALLAVAVCGVGSLALIAKLLLAPLPGEWAVPLHIGPTQWQISVPSLLRLATSPWLGPWLNNRRITTPWGPVRMGWQDGTRTLQLHCAPCRLPVLALGAQPLQVAWLTVSLRRDFDALEGSLIAVTTKPADIALQATFTGRLQQDGLSLRITAPTAPIAHWYAVLTPALPELQRATIDGSLALQARLELPSGRWNVEPTVAGFAVRGLGTEVLANAASTCGPPSRLRNNDWLTRAVIAAEDQRFFEHPGYDMQELSASFATNQNGNAVARGGSTLTQQLAKRLVTGDERSAQRKLRELLYAVEMEQTLGKTRILQLYLDNAPWGASVCGAEVAARNYFQRSARRLEPAQAVWLAAMLHNPDAEAQQWAQRGEINLARAQWVANGVRGIARLGPRERDALLQRLPTLGQERVMEQK